MMLSYSYLKAIIEEHKNVCLVKKWLVEIRILSIFYAKFVKNDLEMVF